VHKVKTNTKLKGAPKAEAKRRGPATLDSEEARRRINIRWDRPGAREAQSVAVRARLAAKAKEEAKAERAAKRAAKAAEAAAEVAKAERAAKRASRKAA
jgi:hypothetical protein